MSPYGDPSGRELGVLDAIEALAVAKAEAEKWEAIDRAILLSLVEKQRLASEVAAGRIGLAEPAARSDREMFGGIRGCR